MAELFFFGSPVKFKKLLKTPRTHAENMRMTDLRTLYTKKLPRPAKNTMTR
jgi:hypothetical protein